MTVTPANQDKILKFIADNPMGVLSTISATNDPWGSAIYVVADELLNFYFVTRNSTAKYDNFKKNPKVALTVVNADRLEAVQLTGEITELQPGDHRHDIFLRLALIQPKDASQAWLPPVVRIESGAFVICQITPTFLQFADFGNGTTQAEGFIKPIIGG